MVGIWRFGALRFGKELAGAVDRVNYNQPIDQMNALAALVSYLPAADPSLFSIQEGNSQLPGKLLARAVARGRARVLLGRGVREVRRLKDGRYDLIVNAVSGEKMFLGWGV